MPRRKSDGFSQTGDIEQQVLLARKVGRQPAIEKVDHIATRAGERQIETAEAGFDRSCECLKDAARAGISSESVPHHPQFIE